VIAKLANQCSIIHNGLRIKKLYITWLFATSLANNTKDGIWKTLLPKRTISKPKITLHTVSGIKLTITMFFLSSLRGMWIWRSTFVNNINKSHAYNARPSVNCHASKNACHLLLVIAKKEASGFSRHHCIKILIDVENHNEIILKI